MSEPAAGTTAIDTTALRSAAGDVSNAAASIAVGVAAYDSIPIDTLSLLFGPVGGEFLAAFDAATQRHRDVVAHTGRVLDGAAEVMRVGADAIDAADTAGAQAIDAAGVRQV